MRFFCLLLALLFVGAQANAQTNVHISGSGSVAAPAGTYVKNLGVTTYTEATLTLSGVSQTLFAASDTSNSITIYNTVSNASVWVNLSGGTAVIDRGMLIPAGITAVITGSVVPKTAITVIGTNTQVLSTMEGH